MWNQFWRFLRPKNCHFDSFQRPWIYECGKFQPCKIAKIQQNQDSGPLKLLRIIFFECFNSQNVDFTQNLSCITIPKYPQCDSRLWEKVSFRLPRSVLLQKHIFSGCWLPWSIKLRIKCVHPCRYHFRKKLRYYPCYALEQTSEPQTCRVHNVRGLEFCPFDGNHAPTWCFGLQVNFFQNSNLDLIWISRQNWTFENVT